METTSASVAERISYGLVRALIAVAGVIWILATIVAELMMPGLAYDHLSEPPPLPDRLPGIALSLGMGLLLCVPHRWTCGWAFYLRLLVYGFLSFRLLYVAIRGVVDGLAGGKSWHIFPASAAFALLGVALPLCLVWSRRLVRHCTKAPPAMEESPNIGTGSQYTPL
jgi:hypothetical protein